MSGDVSREQLAADCEKDDRIRARLGVICPIGHKECYDCHSGICMRKDKYRTSPPESRTIARVDWLRMNSLRVGTSGTFPFTPSFMKELANDLEGWVSRHTTLEEMRKEEHQMYEDLLQSERDWRNFWEKHARYSFFYGVVITILVVLSAWLAS